MHRHYHDRTHCGLSGCECPKYTSRYFWVYKTVILLVALGLIMLWVVAMVRAVDP